MSVPKEPVCWSLLGCRGFSPPRRSFSSSLEPLPAAPSYEEGLFWCWFSLAKGCRWQCSRNWLHLPVCPSTVGGRERRPWRSNRDRRNLLFLSLICLSWFLGRITWKAHNCLHKQHTWSSEHHNGFLFCTDLPKSYGSIRELLGFFHWQLGHFEGGAPREEEGRGECR